VTPVSEILAPQLRPWRVGTALFSTFGIVAVVLAAVGLYGVLALRVAQEKRAFGIRLALGASQSRVWRTVMWRGTSLPLLGTIVGIVCAGLLAPACRSLLYGISEYDPAVFVGSGAVVVLTSIVASCVPAARAARPDISALMREE